MKVKNLDIVSDFEARIIKETDFDVDLFVDLNYRSVNVFGFFKSCISRLQFQSVRAIIIRVTSENEMATVHILRDIDLFSAFANFEFNYKNKVLNINKSEFSVNFNLNEKDV